jgi:hypothetical protein
MVTSFSHTTYFTVRHVGINDGRKFKFTSQGCFAKAENNFGEQEVLATGKRYGVAQARCSGALKEHYSDRCRSI